MPSRRFSSIREDRTRLGARMISLSCIWKRHSTRFPSVARGRCAQVLLRPGEALIPRPRARWWAEAPGWAIAGCAGMNSLGILYGPVSGKNACPIGIVPMAAAVDQQPRFNVGPILADAATNTLCLPPARTPELTGEKLGATFPQTTASKRARQRSVPRALVTGVKAAGAYLSESHGWELPDWFRADTRSPHRSSRHTVWVARTGLTGNAERTDPRRNVKNANLEWTNEFDVKVLVQGRGRLRVAKTGISCNNVDVQTGPRLSYTPGQTKGGRVRRPISPSPPHGARPASWS